MWDRFISKRKTPRQPVISIYLGDHDKRLKRLERLDALAAEFGVTRSALFQKIADGELLIIRHVDFPSRND